MNYLIRVDFLDALVEVTGADSEMQARRKAFKVVYGDNPEGNDRSIKDLTEVIPISYKVNLPEKQETKEEENG